MSVTLLPGELFVERSYDPTHTPQWCNETKDLIVNRLDLSWTPQARLDVIGPATANVESQYFSVGEPWLNAHLGLEIREQKAQIYLKVAPEHVTRVIGTFKCWINHNTIVSESFFSNSNVDNCNRWVWPIDHKYLVFGQNRTLSMNIKVFAYVVIIDCKCNQSDFRNWKIAKDIGSLQLDKDSFDITLKAGSTELGAHKCILRARSPVLKAMLSADMLEGRTGVIEMKDISVAAAEAFLTYIYSAQIEEKELTETAEELLSAATMYDMPDLHTFSENALCNMITVENVGRLLLLACLHDAQKLKTDALAFVKSNKAEVTASAGWKEVIAANPPLILGSFVDIF